MEENKHNMKSYLPQTHKTEDKQTKKNPKIHGSKMIEPGCEGNKKKTRDKTKDTVVTEEELQYLAVAEQQT